MTKKILLLHEKAIKLEYLDVQDFQAIHIWDDEYYKKRNYSFKRLFFIYESFCDLDIKIYHGDTLETLKELGVEELLIPDSSDSHIQELIVLLKDHFKTVVIPSKSFANIPDNVEFKRFFKYWNKAKKSLMKH